MPPGSMSLAGARVLVVEDEPLIQMMLEDMLADFGCAEVAAVGNAHDAEALLEGKRVDVVILDIHLSSSTSYALAATLTERDIPFVFATGSGSDELPREFRHVPTIIKPYSAETLEATLTSVLRASLPATSATSVA